MSHLLDLDEYTDQAIVEEYNRRMQALVDGNCTYCHKRRDVCGCKMRSKPGMFTRFTLSGEALLVEYVPQPARMLLPTTDYFYNLAMERSAELKKERDAEHPPTVG